MNDAPVTARCPAKGCGVSMNCPGGKIYGVHFAKVTDSRPCVMSYKSIVDGTILTFTPSITTDIGIATYDHDPGDEHDSR